MKAVVFAILLAVVGFAAGAFTTPIASSGPGAVWDAFSTFRLYPGLLEQGSLTNPIIGAVIGAAVGAVLGRPKRA